ncbi:MAG: L-aspartate oxidase [Frankiales bacterium]|nr:L-aspartate oxidase [Frankiales bacterium]
MTRRRLLAPAPGWTTSADVVVVGSGVAGLTAALHATRAGSVLLVTKVLVDDGSTRWAQGGVAAALGPEDSPRQHAQDTLVAGVGLCDEQAVDVLCAEGPGRLRELMALGAAFDRAPDGELSLTREGGHHRDRIVHAGGDATGAEVQRALAAAVRAHPRIRVVEHALVLDLLRDAAGRAAGVTLHVLGQGTEDGVGAARARAVVLATGGLGQVFSSTTNPAVSTGDGVALALRAGADVADLEFVQFHPTALFLGADLEGQQPLVSEAVRGEGAVLVDGTGRRVITEQDHPMADLAPRDVVAKAITRRMHQLRVDHVFLDATHLGADLLLRRFPTIVARCRQSGIDPVTEPIPVAPAAHYASGGVRTGLTGRTTVPGLYACGEVACTGVHGANRLASNSLLEGLVFAGRIGDDLAGGLPDPGEPVAGPGEVAGDPAGTVLLDPSVRPELARAMTEGAGVLRSAASLERTAKVLDQLAGRTTGVPEPAAWEATGLHAVASALVEAARRREETRGAHWREDFPLAVESWRGHLVTSSRGTIFEPCPSGLATHAPSLPAPSLPASGPPAPGPPAPTEGI